MIMTMYELMAIAMALSKCSVDPPNDAGCQFIRDSSGNLVGEIHWVLGSISIYEDYPHHREAIRAIEESTGKRFKDSMITGY